MVKDLSERLKTLHHGLENGLSYLIPHLGRLMETEPARRLVRIVLIAVHLAMAILLTYLLNSWLNIFYLLRCPR